MYENVTKNVIKIVVFKDSYKWAKLFDFSDEEKTYNLSNPYTRASSFPPTVYTPPDRGGTRASSKSDISASNKKDYTGLTPRETFEKKHGINRHSQESTKSESCLPSYVWPFPQMFLFFLVIPAVAKENGHKILWTFDDTIQFVQIRPGICILCSKFDIFICFETKILVDFDLRDCVIPTLYYLLETQLPTNQLLALVNRETPRGKLQEEIENWEVFQEM